jgi:DNA-binding IclR family transcriptional regulator
MILAALDRASVEAFGDMTINDLCESTGLPMPTVRDNVNLLLRQGRIETYRDDNRIIRVRLPQ